MCVSELILTGSPVPFKCYNFILLCDWIKSAVFLWLFSLSVVLSMGIYADSRVCCLSLISATVKNYWPKPTWLRKKFIWLMGHSASLRDTRAGTQGRNLHNHCLMACSLWIAQLAFFHTTQNQLARGGTVYSDLSPSKLVYRLIWWKYFLCWCFLFPGCSCLVSSRQNLPSTLVHYCGWCCSEQECEMSLSGSFACGLKSTIAGSCGIKPRHASPSLVLSLD